MKTKFFRCGHCGNLIGMINDSGVPIVCCGEKMEALVPNTVEASGEKHLPVVKMDDGKLTVKDLCRLQSAYYRYGKTLPKDIFCHN